jgi:glucoamylase
LALTGELPNRATLALGFAASKESVSTLALVRLMDDFESVWDLQRSVGEYWLGAWKLPAMPDELGKLLLQSAMVFKVHQDRTYPGAAVASLAIPWGKAARAAVATT